ncbi:hypothetical protein ACHAQA_005962 [Verticillium albo-atrum]
MPEPHKPVFAPETNGYFYTETRVVTAFPKNPPPEFPTSVLGKIRNAFRSTAVKAAERTPQTPRTTYHMDERGRIIETKYVRAGQQGGIYAGGASGS